VLSQDTINAYVPVLRENYRRQLEMVAKLFPPLTEEQRQQARDQAAIRGAARQEALTQRARLCLGTVVSAALVEEVDEEVLVLTFEDGRRVTITSTAYSGDESGLRIERA
jgi:hypothetical protein